MTADIDEVISLRHLWDGASCKFAIFSLFLTFAARGPEVATGREFLARRYAWPMLPRPFLLLTIALASGVSGMAQGPVVPPPAAPTSTLAPLVERYSADRQSLMRRYTVEYSPERYARLTRFYKEWQQE